MKFGVRALYTLANPLSKGGFCIPLFRQICFGMYFWDIWALGDPNVSAKNKTLTRHRLAGVTEHVCKQSRSISHWGQQGCFAGSRSRFDAVM